VCEGEKGLSTGQYSIENSIPEPLAPKLGKLPIPPIIDLACGTTMREEVFKGDPGSTWLGNCPGGCTDLSGTVWGTMIYHRDSSICRAAIHTGCIKDGGGLVQIAFSMPVHKLYSTMSYSIQS